jgi:hypothetical protein
VEIAFNSPTYIAVTCDGTGTVKFWINPTSVSPTATIPSSTNYKAVDQSQSLGFFIGTGLSFEPLRSPTNPTGSPLFAFNGKIQDVALYSSPLGGSAILSHYQTGSGG